MAVSLLSHEVSDLCIGKPPLRSLPAAATVGEALVALKLCGETFLSVAAEAPPSSSAARPRAAAEIAGKVCMVDVVCHLCAEDNIAAPVAALRDPVSALLAKGDGIVRRVDARSSILEALDALLESSAQTLAVPIRPPFRKKQAPQEFEFCWLTQEDLVRFFLNNIFLFSSIAALSVTDLGLVRPSVLSVRHREPAISALPLIRAALADNASVAVLSDDGKLVGEISPSTLSGCDETAAAAIAALSAGDLMSYIDCCSCGGAPESVAQAIKSRLKDKKLDGMLEFIDDDELISTLSLSPAWSASSSSSSSSDEESPAVKVRPRRMKSGSYSARMGRRSEEAIVCHPESSLVAVMVQALAHRVSYVWVVDDEDYELVGIVTFQDVLKLFREQLN